MPREANYLIEISSLRCHGGRIQWRWTVQRASDGSHVEEGVENEQFNARLRAKDATTEDELALSYKPTVILLTENDL